MVQMQCCAVIALTCWPGGSASFGTASMLTTSNYFPKVRRIKHVEVLPVVPLYVVLLLHFDVFG